jgi:peptide/nickel transport system substrate-binding protein
MKVIRGILFAFIIILFHAGSAPAAPRDALVIAQPFEPTTLDPQKRGEEENRNFCLNIFDTLLYRSTDLKIKPLLATSYRQINDLTWEFNLRRGVKFHNGEDFNAASVKFTLERMTYTKNQLRQIFMQEVLDRVEVIDDHKVRIITKRPRPGLDEALCVVGEMLPPKYVQESGPTYIATHPVGTGPYKFVHWVKGDHLLLEANENYWRGAPKIKKVIFRPIPDVTERVTGLQTHEFDIVVDVPPRLARLINRSGHLLVSKVPSLGVVYMAFDTTRGGPVADKRVRRAISQAIDLNRIIKNVLGGYAVKVGSPLPPIRSDNSPKIRPYPYNPEQAKKLLAEAGYPKGFDFVLHAPNNYFPYDKEVTGAVAGYLRKVGINASLKTYGLGAYMTMIYRHNAHPAYILEAEDPTLNAGNSLFLLLRSGQIYSNFSNPGLDILLDEVNTTMNKIKRRKIYSDVAKLINEEVPWAFAYQPIDIHGVNKRVKWKPRLDELLFVFDMSFRK